MKSEFRFLAPDNRKYHCASNRAWFSNRCESTMQVSASVLDGRYPDQVQGGELQAVFAGGFDIVASESLDAAVVSRLSVPGGEFVVYRSSQEQLQGLAVWRGPHHDLGAWIPPVSVSAGFDPWSRFAGLDIQDTPDGMLVTPSLGSELVVTITDVTNYIEGVGMLYLHAPQAALGSVPARSGKKTKVGEVWKFIANEEARATGAQDHFVVANEAAVAVLVPEDSRKKDFAPQLSFIDSLVVLETTA